ncbi:MAG TPA: hypothetical protein VHA14_17270 [Bryobacteraceae bacterium]|nr:hypothetical protein [Bryobacteraceae bacterium]
MLSNEEKTIGLRNLSSRRIFNDKWRHGEAQAEDFRDQEARDGAEPLVVALAAAAPIAAKAGSEAVALPSLTATVQGLDPALEWSEETAVLLVRGAKGDG